jgi:hypothetical protein
METVTKEDIEKIAEDTTEIRLYITPHQNGSSGALRPCLRGAILFSEGESAMLLRLETDAEKSFDDQWSSFCKTLAEVICAEDSPVKRLVGESFEKTLGSAIVS